MGVPNRLGMKDWIVLETQEDAYNMRVVAGKPVQPEVCPRCGVENPRVDDCRRLDKESEPRRPIRRTR